MKNIIIIFSLLILLIPSFAVADITFTSGFWSTTFNCGEYQLASSGDAGFDVCDELDAIDFYNNIPGTYTTVSSSFNHTAGDGGGAYRHYYEEVRNSHSDVLSVNLGSGSSSNVWARFYVRWESGMTWGAAGENKVIYFYTGANRSSPYVIMDAPWTTLSSTSLDTAGWSIGGLGDDYGNLRSDTGGWASMQDDAGSGINAVSDGGWDCMEVQVKSNSAIGVADGELRIWINGTLLHEVLAYDIRTGTGSDGIIRSIDIGMNHNVAVPVGANPTTWEDYDDLAIATSSYTGFVKDAFDNDMIGPLTDIYKPVVISTVPTTDATGVALNSTITATYNEDITCAAPVVTVSGATVGSITCSGAVLTIPVTGQVYATLSNVSINGVFDTAAVPNEQTVAYAYSYQTAANPTAYSFDAIIGVGSSVINTGVMRVE